MAKTSLPMNFETLNEFVDGRLSREEAAEVAAAVASNPALAKELAEISKLNEQIQSVGADVLEEPVPDRLRQIVQPKSKKENQSSMLFIILRRTAALGLTLLIGFVGGYFTKNHFEPNNSGLLKPFIEQAVLSHQLFDTGGFGDKTNRIPIAPESELANVSLHAPIRIPISLGADLEPVSVRTLTSATGAAIQVAYLDDENALTSLLVRELSDEDSLPARFVDQDGYQILYWIDGPSIYALVGQDVNQEQLKQMAKSIYSSNAVGELGQVIVAARFNPSQISRPRVRCMHPVIELEQIPIILVRILLRRSSFCIRLV